MICEKCGANIENGALFCSVCGASAPVQQPQQGYYQQPPVQQPQQPAYQQPYYQQPQQPYYPQPAQPAQPPADLGWFKFLIYFALFAGAVLNFINGIMALTGAHYMGDADMVYRVFPDLVMTDILYGVGCIGAAVLGLVARFSLAGYKAIGPKLLTALYALVAGLGIVYIIMVSAATNGLVDETSSFGNIAVNIVFMCINIAYFKKRAHLFVN